MSRGAAAPVSARSEKGSMGYFLFTAPSTTLGAGKRGRGATGGRGRGTGVNYCKEHPHAHLVLPLEMLPLRARCLGQSTPMPPECYSPPRGLHLELVLDVQRALVHRGLLLVQDLGLALAFQESRRGKRQGRVAVCGPKPPAPTLTEAPTRGAPPLPPFLAAAPRVEARPSPNPLRQPHPRRPNPSPSKPSQKPHPWRRRCQWRTPRWAQTRSPPAFGPARRG